MNYIGVISVLFQLKQSCRSALIYNSVQKLPLKDSDLKSRVFRCAFVINIIMSSVCDRPLNQTLGERERMKVRKNNKRNYDCAKKTYKKIVMIALCTVGLLAN